MTSKQLFQLLKERWKSCLLWLGVFAFLAFALLLLGYVPVYGNDRLMVSRVLIVLAIVGSIAFLAMRGKWRASLQKALEDEYGERCCVPIPKAVPEDIVSAGETA